MNSRSTFIIFLVVLAIMLFADQQMNIPVWLYPVIAALFLLANVYGSLNVDSQFFTRSLFRGSANKKTIALTFDDGPVPGKTEKILDILDKHGVKATFFCIGKMATDNPELLKSIDQRGHLIGNHSFYHGPLFDLQSSSRMKNELMSTDSIIYKILGRRPRYFRPPYGVTNPMLSKAVSQTGHLTIGWSMRSFDTVINDKKKLITRITKGLKAGDILLLHDKCEVTAQALPELLSYISQSGMTVEPLDKMLDEAAYA